MNFYVSRRHRPLLCVSVRVCLSEIFVKIQPLIPWVYNAQKVEKERGGCFLSVLCIGKELNSKLKFDNEKSYRKDYIKIFVRKKGKF